MDDTSLSVTNDDNEMHQSAQQFLLPSLKNNNSDRSMELFREIMINGDNGERDFKEMVDEFLQLIESKLSDTEMQMFESSPTRTTSPTLFDTLNDLKTCLSLLRRTEIQSLLNVFDHVLKLHCYSSALPETDQTLPTKSIEELAKLSQYAIDEVKIVKIEKTCEPLGLTITRSDSGTIHIARIIVGSLAAATQLFQIDDQILEINDQPITGQPLDSICSLLSQRTGLIKFLLSPPIKSRSISYEIFHVRALFTYDPYADPLIPCKELGLEFHRGEILRIVARDEPQTTDTDWWQAYRETDRLNLAGLIPSDSLQTKRSNLVKLISDDNETKQVPTIPTIRTSINHFSLTDTRQFDNEKSSTILRQISGKATNLNKDFLRFYEPVIQLDLSTRIITRPIVLIGAPNVGRHELRRRLLQNDSHLFDIAIPHTTRPRRLQETPDVDYHFVSEADFLAQVACRSFIEFGQYERHLYGTSIDDIRLIAETKQKICILNLNPDAIHMFDRTNLYPYIICIAAPSFERLKRLELDRREYLTEKDYRDILRQSRAIEKRYYSLFDQILVNQDLDRTYTELRELILNIQQDKQPWVRTSYENFANNC